MDFGVGDGKVNHLKSMMFTPNDSFAPSNLNDISPKCHLFHRCSQVESVHSNYVMIKSVWLVAGLF